MQIHERIVGIPIGVFPCLYYALENATNYPSCHEALKVRHPFSIYNVSLITIMERIQKLLTLVTPLYGDPKNLTQYNERTDGAIRDATDAVLDALMEHFDDCINVLKCYLDQGPEKQKKKVMALVQANWDCYRNHVGKIVNHIKHKQRRVRTIVFQGNDWAVPGYFIEGPAGPKLLGPDPEIHTGGGTAYSFKRNLSFHLCGIYSISRSMCTGLAEVDRAFSNVKPSKSVVSHSEKKWTEMARDISSLSPLVFPDEVSKGNPLVKISKTSLIVEYPSKTKSKVVPPHGRISTLFVVDSMSPSFRLPYFKMEDHI